MSFDQINMEHNYQKSKEKELTKKQKRKLRFVEMGKKGLSARYGDKFHDSQTLESTEQDLQSATTSSEDTHVVDSASMDECVASTDNSTDDTEYFPTPSKRHMLDCDSKGGTSQSGMNFLYIFCQL